MDFWTSSYIARYGDMSSFVLLVSMIRVIFDFIFIEFVFSKSPKLRQINKIASILLIMSLVFVFAYSIIAYSQGVRVQLFLIFAYVCCAVSYFLFFAVVGLKIHSLKLNKSDISFNFFEYCGSCFKSLFDAGSRSKFLVLWILSVFVYTYMTCFFGVTELYFGNIQEWHFVYSDMLFPILVSFGIAIITILIGICVSKFKFFKYLSFFFAIFVLVSYFQYLFLGGSNFINGSIRVSVMDCAMELSRTFVFIVIFVGACCAYKKYKEKLLRVFIGSVVAVFVMLIVPTVVIFVSQSDVPDRNVNKYVLTGSDQFELGCDKNVVVFVMDSLSQEYVNVFMNDFVSSNPDTNLKDFVNYVDVGSNFCATSMAMPSILTGEDADMTKGTFDRNEALWHNKSSEYFYKLLHDDGFVVNLYTDSVEYCGGGDNMVGKIDNVEQIDLVYNVDAFGVYGQMLKLSFYEYLPKLFKSFMYVSGSDEINVFAHEIHGYDADGSNFDYTNENTDASKKIAYKNSDFYNKLVSNGLSVDESNCNRMNIIHLHGMHGPFLDTSDNASSPDRVFFDVIGMIDIYCDQMKKLGLYDDSLIIITADHGEDESHSGVFGSDMSASGSAFMVKLPCAHNDAMSINNSPGYLPTDFLPTILDGLGYDYDVDLFDGFSLFRLDENVARRRRHYLLVYSYDYPNVPKCVGFGDAIYNVYLTIEYDSIGELSNVSVLNDEDKFLVRPLIDDWW